MMMPRNGFLMAVRGLLPRIGTVASIGCLLALIGGTALARASTGSVSESQFNDVACTSAQNCMAVGWYQASGRGSVYFTLAEAWNGSAWTIVTIPSPQHRGGGAQLNAISCISSTDCMAVGESLILTSTGNLVPSPLAEAWNGSRWTIVPTPKLRNAGASLNDIACTSASACMAVGNRGTPASPNDLTLAESWNGSNWKLVRTPPPPARGTALSGISCTSSASCMAVGYYGFNGANNSQITLSEHWNGTTWRILTTPNPGNSGALGGVACSSASACMATGDHFVKNSATRIIATLSEHWDGTRWHVQPSPNPAAAALAAFGDVSCVSPSACMGVGTATDDTGEENFTLAQSWNGTSWTIVNTPSPGSFIDTLNGVSCTAATACMAVGAFDGTANVFTLAERWNGTSWTMLKTPVHP
jgi:hypothetical protein